MKVGIHGRDTDAMIKDLVEAGIVMETKRRQKVFQIIIFFL